LIKKAPVFFEIWGLFLWGLRKTLKIYCAPNPLKGAKDEIKMVLSPLKGI